MRSDQTGNGIVRLIILGVLGCILASLIVIYLATATSTSTVGTIPATVVPTPASTTAVILTPGVEPGLIVISPTVAVGQRIPLPLDGHLDITFVRVDSPSLITLKQARTAVYNHGLDWALGGSNGGKVVTLTAAYGVATLGGGAGGTFNKPDLGQQGIPALTCYTNGTCTSVLVSLPERRPVWILDYGNTEATANNPVCITTPCPTPQIFNHSVYTIDDRSNTILSTDFYSVP